MAPAMHPRIVRAILVVLILDRGICAAAENPAEALERVTIEVVGTTPLPGLAVPLKDVPANVQIFTSRDVDRQRPINVQDYLDRNAASVSLNAAQGNPFQPDISFRGFTASPLLGLPQGLSVFQDGVRVNEPFGDVVNWDLIPGSAISSMQLLPGATPAFGLNTLGGALAIYTKSGSEYPGGALQAYGGSFGRKALEGEFGGKHERWDYFVTGNWFDDNGWAEHNPSRVKQLFGKVGWQTEETDADLSVTLARNRLEGTQTLPVSFLDTPREAYTFPDINNNRLAMVALKASRFLGEGVLVGGNAYYRKYRNDNTSSNLNDNFGEIDPATGAIDTVQARNDRSAIDQESAGLGLQVTLAGRVLQRRNQFILGASGDFGKARFTQEAQEAFFDASRGAVPVGDFAGVTDALTRNRYYGIWFADTLNLDERWTLSLSGRYNRASESIRDRTGAAPALDGDHVFARFNPAVGVAFTPRNGLTTFANYTEGMRAPSPIELTCSDPDAPCKLPNNFLADPELKKVVSHTVEAGARGKAGDDHGWSAAVYRTDLVDDIQFVSSGAGATTAGFFQNVGRTRRQGVEIFGSTRFASISLSARYSYTDATFRSSFVESSPSNSTSDAEGNIRVESGNRIPGIPRHLFKLRAEYGNAGRFAVGASLLTQTDTVARGNENNRDAGGTVPGYAVLNLDGRVEIAKGLEIFARVDNVFDRLYSNFAVLGTNFFAGPDRSFDPENTRREQFRGIGAPRGAWVGVRYEWR